MALASTFCYFTRPRLESGRTEELLRDILWQQNQNPQANQRQRQRKREKPLPKVTKHNQLSFRTLLHTRLRKMKST